MPAETAAARRMRTLLRALPPPEAEPWLPVISVEYTAAGDGTLRIGNVSAPLSHPRRADLVPYGYALAGGEADETARHLRWLMQKDLNGQDMFLIGPPGPYKRRLVMLYCELRRREVEYLCLSRDTTESDLKQRREILPGGSTSYTDQAPVRAAVEGRILILDGLERAERNVLPTLNNLLENREMTLEDGRLLLGAERYDELLAQYPDADQGGAELAARGLVRVSPEFRVVALGLPIPLFPGRPLDPPLRSRFQARSVPAGEAESLAAELLDGEEGEGEEATVGGLSTDMLRSVVGLAGTLRLLERQSGGIAAQLPHFADPAVRTLARSISMFPAAPPAAVLGRCYPHHLVGKGGAAGEEGDGQSDLVLGALKRFNLMQGTTSAGPSASGDSSAFACGYILAGIEGRDPTQGRCVLIMAPEGGGGTSTVRVSVPCGALVDSVDVGAVLASLLPEQQLTLSAMLMDHAVGADLCVLGGAGSGKTTVARAFGKLLGYAVSTIHCFADMTSRDLLQRRGTDAVGATRWESTALIRAAVLGELAILDGTHRTPPDVLAILQRLLHDRELELFDGR